jgi:hypothetical protein
VGEVLPRWELVVGEFAVDGHRGAVVVHRRGKGTARAGRPNLLGRTEGASRARERERRSAARAGRECARLGRRGVLGRAQEKREGSGPSG